MALAALSSPNSGLILRSILTFSFSPMSSFNKLPPELTQLVLLYVQPEDYQSIAATCRRVYNIASNHYTINLRRFYHLRSIIVARRWTDHGHQPSIWYPRLCCPYVAEHRLDGSMNTIAQEIERVGELLWSKMKEAQKCTQVMLDLEPRLLELVGSKPGRTMIINPRFFGQDPHTITIIKRWTESCFKLIDAESPLALHIYKDCLVDRVCYISGLTVDTWWSSIPFQFPSDEETTIHHIYLYLDQRDLRRRLRQEIEPLQAQLRTLQQTISPYVTPQTGPRWYQQSDTGAKNWIYTPQIEVATTVEREYKILKDTRPPIRFTFADWTRERSKLMAVDRLAII